MRHPRTRRPGAGQWILSYGLAGALALAAAWWMGLFTGDPASLRTVQETPVDRSAEEPDLTGDAEDVDPALFAEQWEPDPASAAPMTESADQELVTANGIRAVLDPVPEATDVPATPRSIPPADAAADRTPEPVSGRSRVVLGGGTAPAEDTTGRIVLTGGEESPADRFGEIDNWIENAEYLKAHRELSKLYWNEPELMEQLLPRLEKTAGVIYLSPQPHFMEPYEIQSGDLLQNIAPKYQISWEYLSRLNRVQPEKIRAGRTLKVVKGPFSAFVDLSEFALTIHAHGYFVKRYKIGIGKDNSTPIGTFQVKDKLKNPIYYGPDGVVGADDPQNPLGERWIDIGDSYGIHGTIDPQSIGKAESRGCVRLQATDVEEVYDFLTVGSEVVIRP